jgi:AcrR family transcriptional regulator/DNA-binding MarR family transcriptional regulator
MSGGGRASSNGAAPRRLRIRGDTREDGFSRKHHDGHKRVTEIQRARMLAAVTEVASEQDAGGVTVARIVDRAGVSRRTFYEVFADCEDCLLAAFDRAVACASERVVEAYRGQKGWRDRLRASLLALLVFLDDQPFMGRLLIVESLGGGSGMLERRRRVVSTIVETVDEGRAEAKVGSGATPITAEGIVGAVLSVIHARLLEEDHKPLVELVNPLMNMIVLPYQGPAAARKELTAPIPKTTQHPTSTRSPLNDLHMRLTYRTIRVLAYIATHPQSSNRTIGEASGITDQGQTSKLLTRLTKLGLIENTGIGPTRGEPNAWTLTPHGTNIHNAITQQTTPA